MKRCTWLLVILMGMASLAAQTLPQRHEIEAHLRFLADDALEGRLIGTRGHDIAAQYIESQLVMAGVEKVPGKDSYRQSITFDRQTPARNGTLRYADIAWTHGEEFIWRAGNAAELSAEPVFVGYGEVDTAAGIDDLAGKDLDGKIVIAYLGTRATTELAQIAQASREKRARFQKAGAVALLEIYKLNIPWGYIKAFLLREQVRMQEQTAAVPDDPLLYGWIQEATDTTWAYLLENPGGNMELQSSGNASGTFTADNVIGWIPGSDPALADEYMIISAHYDHVGIGNASPADPADTIYNGARDNAIGTTGLLTAARYLAEKPPRRSVLLLAVTAEESGLLGSQYYAANPWLPLNKAVFDFNSDGGGYNDTTAVAVVGYDRCGVEKDLESMASKYELKVIADPSPEQGLFDRSDNASFAAVGVPCLNYSPGMTALDAAIMRYYHQPADGPESLNYSYLTRFYKAFVETVRVIADRDRKPFWKEGDKYEAAGKALYGME